MSVNRTVPINMKLNFKNIKSDWLFSTLISLFQLPFNPADNNLSNAVTLQKTHDIIEGQITLLHLSFFPVGILPAMSFQTPMKLFNK